jgi:hypothetical protein
LVRTCHNLQEDSWHIFDWLKVLYFILPLIENIDFHQKLKTLFKQKHVESLSIKLCPNKVFNTIFCSHFTVFVLWKPTWRLNFWRLSYLSDTCLSSRKMFHFIIKKMFVFGTTFKLFWSWDTCHRDMTSVKNLAFSWPASTKKNQVKLQKFKTTSKFKSI